MEYSRLVLVCAGRGLLPASRPQQTQWGLFLNDSHALHVVFQNCLCTVWCATPIQEVHCYLVTHNMQMSVMIDACLNF